MKTPIDYEGTDTFHKNIHTENTYEEGFQTVCICGVDLDAQPSKKQFGQTVYLLEKK
jgi:hypothetical protein